MNRNCLSLVSFVAQGPTVQLQLTAWKRDELFVRKNRLVAGSSTCVQLFSFLQCKPALLNNKKIVWLCPPPFNRFPLSPPQQGDAHFTVSLLALKIKPPTQPVRSLTRTAAPAAANEVWTSFWMFHSSLEFLKKNVIRKNYCSFNTHLTFLCTVDTKTT